MTKRTVLITGASKGIGLATALYLKEKGFHCVGIARSHPDFFPGDFYACNLMDANQTDAVLKTISRTHQVTILINNMAFVVRESIERLSLENLHKIYDGNMRVAVQCVQAVLPNMKQERFGRIVNISSRAGLQGVEDRTAYGAAKAAMALAVRTWARELGHYQITANAVAPGPIETELFRNGTPIGSEQEKRFLSQIPLNRVGQVRDIAAAIGFLVSDEAGFITGQVLSVDGGMSA